MGATAIRPHSRQIGSRGPTEQPTREQSEGDKRLETVDFLAYLEQTQQRVTAYIRESDVRGLVGPEDLKEGVVAYLERPAKRLRPAVLMLAAGSLGGEERERLALPAAAGVELFHTWTLVHDDMIDNDSLRRGEPTVHAAMAAKSRETLGLSERAAEEYGRDIALLAGDMLHGWSVASFLDCASQPGVAPALVVRLVRRLQTHVLANLIFGEVRDVQFGLKRLEEIPGIDEAGIVNMLWLKTGVLYEFAGLAGAAIGKNSADFHDEQIAGVSGFAKECGTAFQLQDDILGILGDERTLGKPVGSDIREGKKTVIVFEAMQNASESERRAILSVLGNRSASEEEIRRVSELLVSLGGVERTRALAVSHIERGVRHLGSVPDSRHKALLQLWADFMVNRAF